ncbi:uncharacterized protein LOC144627331 isoform X2 [Crassostrea virginica]
MEGVLSLSVCIVVIENFSNHDKGWALFVSLISACIEIVNAVLCCCLCIVCRGKSDHEAEFTDLFVSLMESLC